MGKIGPFEYPSLRIQDAIDIITKLNEHFGGVVESGQRDAFAAAIGHKSANNGAFIVKVSDLRKYGLIDNRNPIKITELGKRILFPNTDQEKSEAILEAVNSVSFFKQLIIETGGNPPGGSFHIQLQKMGISREETAEKKDEIIKIYNQILPLTSQKVKPTHLNEVNTPTHSMIPGVSALAEKVTKNVNAPQNHVILENEGTRLVLDLDKTIDIKMAIEYLKTIQEEKGKKHVTIL